MSCQTCKGDLTVWAKNGTSWTQVPCACTVPLSEALIEPPVLRTITGARECAGGGSVLTTSTDDDRFRPRRFPAEVPNLPDDKQVLFTVSGWEGWSVQMVSELAPGEYWCYMPELPDPANLSR